MNDKCNSKNLPKTFSCVTEILILSLSVFWKLISANVRRKKIKKESDQSLRETLSKELLRNSQNNDLII